MNMRKQFSFAAMFVILISCLVLSGCSDVMNRPADEIPSDLRNTTWTRQISDSETVTLNFGRDMMLMSTNGASGQNNQQWNYRGGYCCSYGYCGFNNGPDSLDFRYTSGNDTLNITGSNIQFLNGSWARGKAGTM